MEVRCPHCKTRVRVEEKHFGRTVRCGRCKGEFSPTPTLPAAPGKATMAPARANATDSSAMPEEIGGFAVRRPLGAGAFGAVYLAHDAKLDRLVALKVPHPHTFGSARAVERFEREARAAAALRHPHIVPIYAAGFDGTYYFIASQFISAVDDPKKAPEGAPWRS